MPEENYILDLKKLLELQKTGKLRDINIIKDYIDKHFIGENIGGKAPATDHSVMNIMNEWKKVINLRGSVETVIEK